MGHLKSTKLVTKVINENHSLKYLLNLYNSGKYEPFFLKKRIIYIFLIVSVILFVLGLLLGNSILIIVGGLLGFYCFNYLGQIKGYHKGTIEGLKDGFDGGKATAWLELFESLLKYKERGNVEPEKSVIFLLMLYLSNKFEGFSGMYKNESNNKLLEFDLKELIDKEKIEYRKYDAIEDGD